MKQFYLILLSMLPLAAFSQSTLYFSYDAAGNQVLRDVVCVNCGLRTMSAQKSMSSEAQITVSAAESFTASPNPVTHRLKVQWVNDEASPLEMLQLRSTNGSLLQSFPVKTNTGQTELDFSLYSPGLYLLMGIKSNGQITTVKIIKQ